MEVNIDEHTGIASPGRRFGGDSMAMQMFPQIPALFPEDEEAVAA